MQGYIDPYSLYCATLGGQILSLIWGQYNPVLTSMKVNSCFFIWNNNDATGCTSFVYIHRDCQVYIISSFSLIILKNENVRISVF